MEIGEFSSIQTKISWNPMQLKTGRFILSIDWFNLIIIFRFNLYYYSNTTIKEKVDTILVIDTRNTKVIAKKDVELNEDFDPVEENPLEKAIQTK